MMDFSELEPEAWPIEVETERHWKYDAYVWVCILMRAFFA